MRVPAVGTTLRPVGETAPRVGCGVRVLLTVASWHLDGWHTVTDGQLELLDRSGAQLLLAHEVTSASLDRLRETGWEGVGALELLSDDHVERNEVRPRFGARCSSVPRRE